jgi:serine/threonine protein kinase
MPAPSTADQLLELLSKSGLLDPQQLQSYLQSRHPNGVGSNTPRTLANILVRDGLLTRFQSEQLLLGKWRNFILSGKYKVLGPLGAGGMGHVFLCEHLVMRRRVAVKVLPTSRSNNVAALERFHREARAVARLHHPNIVVGHDIDRDGKLHFLVMEYIDGSTLHQLVRDRGPLDPLRAAHYIRQAALGLQHAHEAGLVHRDVKPSNLLLDRTGTIKVLDLGLARFFRDETDDLSRDNLQSPLGTTDFMAPEQALDSHQADIRADIYSLGATFYYLLAGHSPFREGTVLQKIMSHQIRTPRPIRDIRPEVPEGMAAVLDRMMAKDPAQRYQTPAEVVEALAPWTQTPIPSPDEALTEPIRLGRPNSQVETTPEPPSTRSGPVPPPTPWQQGAPGSQPSMESLLVVAGEPGPTPVPFLDTQSEAGSPMPSPPPPPGRSRKPSAPARPGPSSQPPPLRAAPKRPWLWVIGAAAAAVLVLGSVAGFTIYKMIATKEPPGNGSPAGGPAGGPQVVVDNSPRLRLLVPAYFYPGGEDLKEWEKLINSPAASATVAIVNSSSGPGENADPNYANIIERAKQRGVTVIGYVPTKYAKLPLEIVKADVDKWIKFYPGIQGIFFDEQASMADKVQYYVSLYQHAKGRGLSLVITNPGNMCVEDYFAQRAADVVCIADVTKEFRLQKLPRWADHYPARSFAAVLCQIDAAKMERYILEMRDKKIGYCYITDGHDPNPWKGLPRYWEDEVKAVLKVNAQNAP